MIHWEKEKPNILLWCDGRSTDSLDSSDSPLSCGCKRKSPPVSEPLPSKRQRLDDSIANTVKELKEKHGSKYTFPQLRSSDAMSSPVKSNSSLSVSPTTGVSLTEHCMKKLHELRELQELLEQNILPQQEFMEQKKLVLDCLRKLTRLATVCMVISTYIHT